MEINLDNLYNVLNDEIIKEIVNNERRKYCKEKIDLIKEINKRHYEKYHDNYLEKFKKYYQDNKERIAIKKKEEYEKVIAEGKIECECGSMIYRNNRNHFMTKKHLNYVKNV